MAYGKVERYQEQIAACKEAIRLQPEFAEAHYNLGWAYEQLGRWREAVGPLGRAVRIKPDFAEAHFNLAVAYMALGDRKSAFGQYGLLKGLDQNLAKGFLDILAKQYTYKVETGDPGTMNRNKPNESRCGKACGS